MPIIAPYHSVPNRTMIATPTDIADVMPKSCSKPEIVASATPNPPGIILTAPAKDAKLNVNVACVMLIYSLNPIMTRYIPRHSKNHANALNNDIPIKPFGSIIASKVLCVVLMFSVYFPILVSNLEISQVEIVLDFTAPKNIEKSKSKSKMR